MYYILASWVQQVSMAGIGVSTAIFMFTCSYSLAQIEDKGLFQKVTSITAVNFELGSVVSSISSQYIVSTSGGNYTALPYYNAIGIHSINILPLPLDFLIIYC